MPVLQGRMGRWETGEPETIIVVIHGTYARRAEWIAPTSFFPFIVRAVSEATVTHRFTWTGRNNHTARVRAARRLRRRVRCLRSAFPNSRIFLIGHSHGGNVAMYACKDSATLDAVAGVATLSTPFVTLHFRPDSVGSVTPTEWFLSDTQALADSAAVAAWAAVVWALVFPLLLNALGLALAIAVLSLAALATIVGAFAVSRAIRNAGRARLVWVHENLNPPSLAPGKLLVMRTAADEGSLLLRSAQASTSLVMAVWEFFVRWRDQVQRPIRKYRTLRVTIVLSIVLILLGVYLLNHSIVTTPEGLICISGLFAYGGVLCIALFHRDGAAAFATAVTAPISQPIAWLLLSIRGFFTLPLGREIATCSFFADLSIEDAPPGTSLVINNARLRDGGLRARSLQHSQTYQNIPLAVALVDWMKGKYSVQAPTEERINRVASGVRSALENAVQENRDLRNRYGLK